MVDIIGENDRLEGLKIQYCISPLLRQNAVGSLIDLNSHINESNRGVLFILRCHRELSRMYPPKGNRIVIRLALAIMEAINQ